MAKLYVIQAGRTVWDEQSRIDSAAGAPLSTAGLANVREAARELADRGIRALYAAPGLAEQQSATAAAEVLGARVRTRKDLRELDYGLWQGLTSDELTRRQPKLYRQWLEAPSSVRPPGGESLQEAADRVGEALRRLLRRRRRGAAAAVLRPVVFGLVRCMASAAPLETLWQRVATACTWDVIEADLAAMDKEPARGQG